MITEDAKKVLDTLASFFNENEGNKINRWLAVPLINTIKADLQEILQRDSYVPPTPKKVKKDVVDVEDDENSEDIEADVVDSDDLE